MKSKILKLSILCLFVLFSCQVFSFDGKGKFVVYFSKDVSKNRLYAILLKMKFPDLDTVVVSSDEEFSQHIPLKRYREGKPASYGVLGSASLAKANAELSLPTCYFLDIRSEIKVLTIERFEQGAIRTDYDLYTDRYLHLVKFQNGHFTSSLLLTLDTRKETYTKAKVEFAQFENISDDINPVLITMYLHKLNDETFYNKGNYNACKLKKGDSIYLCPISNNEYVSRRAVFPKREKKFKSRVRYFRHPHRKLQSAEFAQKAIECLENGKSFYFFYFIPSTSKSVLMVIDLKTFEVVYSRSKNIDTIFMFPSMRKYIEKNSWRLVCRKR